MAIIQQTSLGMRRDPDTIRIVDWADSDLSHYFEVNVDETNNVVDFLAKIGDFRFRDADDAHPCTDSFQIVGDPAASGILKKTSNITNSNIFEIRATGTISGVSVTVDIDYFHLDIDALVLDDGAANAITINGYKVDFNGATLTAVGLSEIHGFSFDMGDLSAFAKASVIEVIAASGRISALDTNIRGTISGRIESGAYYFEDHFDNRQARQEWASRVTTGSTGGAGVSTDLNGVNQIITAGVITNEESLDFNDIFTIDNTLRPTFEVRVYLELADGDSNYAFGFVNTNIGNGQAGLSLNQGGAANQDFIIIEYSTTTHGDALWHLSCQLDGASTVGDGAAAAATTWTVLRFEFISDTSVEWFIDGVSQGTVDTNIPTDPMQPILFVLTDAGATRYVDVDYVKIWQDRV